MKTTRTNQSVLAIIVCLVGLGGLHAKAQTATHACAGYIPGTNTTTISCQFSYPEGGFLTGLAWLPQLPSGWLIKAVTGDGGPTLAPDKKAFLFLGDLSNPVLNFSFTVTVPSGYATQVLFRAQAEYYLDFADTAYVWASPDPLAIDNLKKTLQVVSAYGATTPSVGVYTNLVGAVLNMSAAPYSAYVATTQYVCTGWSMTGNAPASGTTNNFTMTVADNAVLTWNWSQFNVAPVVSQTVNMYGLRTTISTMPASKLVSGVSDPDNDTLSLMAVFTPGSQGGTITWAGGGSDVAYQPPQAYRLPDGNRRGFTEVFNYTVADEHGALVTNTLKVTVAPYGTAIRIF